MADETRSAREIERDLEHKRAELQGTLDEITNRLTFDDAWERTGAYLRDNRAEFGQTLGRMIREKPVGFALTVLGLGLMFFGPSQTPTRRRHAADRWDERPEDDRDPFALDWEGDRPEYRSHDPYGMSERRGLRDTGSTGTSSSTDDLGSGSGASSSTRSYPTTPRTASTSSGAGAASSSTTSPSSGASPSSSSSTTPGSTSSAASSPAGAGPTGTSGTQGAGRSDTTSPGQSSPASRVAAASTGSEATSANDPSRRTSSGAKSSTPSSGDALKTAPTTTTPKTTDSPSTSDSVGEGKTTPKSS